MEGPFSVLILLFAVFVVVWFYIVLPARMASRRGRSAFGWVLVSLICSPLLAMFLLLVMGDA
jgi:hypothetical protein